MSLTKASCLIYYVFCIVAFGKSLGGWGGWTREAIRGALKILTVC